MGDTLLAFRPYPIDGLQFPDPVLDHAQDFGSEPPDQLLGQNRPDPFDQTTTEVPLDPFHRRRLHGLHQSGLELESVLFVANPAALGLEPLPGGHGRQRSKDRYLVALSSELYPKHTEPFSSLWKVTRSIRPETSSVLALSEPLAFIWLGIHCPTAFTATLPSLAPHFAVRPESRQESAQPTVVDRVFVTLG